MSAKLKWLPFILISFEIAVYLSMDMYVPCLPLLATDFSISQDFAQYTVTAWFLGELCLMLIVGPISEAFGRKPIIIFGVCLFLSSSIVCTITNNFVLFLLARFFQGASVSVPLVVGYAAVHESFDDQKAMQILSIMGSITILAPTLGPLIGALIAYISNWRNIFLILSVWSSISLLIILLKLPETCTEKTPVDVRKVLVSYKNIITNYKFCKYSIPVAFSFMAIVIWIMGIPFVIKEYYKLQIVDVGLVQLLVFIFFIIGARVTKYLLNEYEAKNILRSGFVISFLGTFIFLMLVVSFPRYLYLTIVGMMLFSFGMSMCIGPSNRLAIAACSEAMAYRTTIFTAICNIIIVVGTFIYTLLNSKTMLNLSMAIFIGGTLSFLYHIIPNMKNIKVRKKNN
ncbi:MAG: multidrug effflux MFS transporter [Legionellales bacterium]|nr:multidrug effflux MFS transporter [Legionellales bacterium]